MYLKALEIQGFKSFPIKTRLSFEKAVTAIVGPNGSGKSNISDAVRWVMGEQSTRALRGGKMEDVIFGGTEKRGPVGFAEVSLILDNEDHIFDMENSEVMVTRRYYRSGESEYYINRQACRLKDINELFMDTGLGREGYSIIGQGRIDEILSIKSTERREIFEEAAGISRFRHRKEESENKLAKSEENLLRVNDKIAELELQVEPLRKQSETAKKYLVLRDELRGLEITVWTENLLKLESGGQKLEDDIKSAVEQLQSTKNALEDMYRENESFSGIMQEKDIESEKIRELISVKESVISEAESAAAVLRANLTNSRESIERVTREISQQEDRDENIRQQIEERKSRMANISNEKEEVKRKTDELIKESEAVAKFAGKAAEELAALVKNENELNACLAGADSAINVKAALIQELEDRSTSIISEKNETEEKLSLLRSDALKNKQELDKAIEDRDSVRNIISGYELRLNGRRAKAEKAFEAKTKLTMDMGAVRSRISMLSEMEKEYQGYSRSVKAVMQDAERKPNSGVYGPIANLIKVKDELAVAIEIAMGGSMQDIVVENEQISKRYIEMLKSRDIGRATFMPLTMVNGRRLDEPMLESEAGFIGIASDLVDFDPKYSGIVRYMIGRIAIADNIDSAIRISKRYKSRFKIVTLDGQVMNAGGSMTGGSTSKNTGILSRANELEKLKAQETVLSEKLAAAVETENAAKRELTAAEYELSVASEEIRGFEDSILKLEAAKKHFNVLLTAAEENFEALSAEYEGISEKIKSAEAEAAALRNDIAEYEKNISYIAAQISEKSGGNEELSAKRQMLQEKLSELRSTDAALDAEFDTISRAVAELEEIRADLSGGKQQQILEIEQLKTDISGINEKISLKEQEITEVSLEVSGMKDKIAKITEEKLEIEAKRSRHIRETQEKNNELLVLERECARLEQKKVSSEMEEKQIIDKLWDTYELSRSDALKSRLEIEDMSAASKRIGELKRKISGLGNPNIGAIDEFERVNTRYTYLTEQRDDIEKAKGELESIIRDITSEMKEIFAREFENIRQGFKDTFVDMFGGGKADLELEDENDILGCGIEIKVQPPGKTLKTITLLSGGEKAFVAIALYFAILKVRPTPFVIMDEIEAALDEANVIRFAEYLRKLTSKTQFLLITHRRGTMEEADVLYGVTMQEKGVSQVLSVDIDEAEKTIGK